MTGGTVGGYPVDIAYPALFHRECGPAWMAMAVTAIGQQAPSIDRPFRYLDLGCGSGLSTALFAAACPQGDFLGVDASASHIALARARAAGLDNIRFVHADFAALAGGRGADEAPFDFIVAHGVYSWIAPDARAAVRRIVAQRLAPGGILYIHYTSHPGQTVFAGAQALMRRVAETTPGDTTARVAAALATLRALDDGGAGYLRVHPAVAALLRRDDADVAYLAHDLLAPDWAALHAGEVIDEWAEAGCAFVGSANLIDNIDALSVPGGCLPVVTAIRDVPARETARDLARNQSVRRDLYRRGLSVPTPEAYRRALGALAFARATPPGRGDLTLDQGIGPVTVAGAMVDPLRAALGWQPATFADLLARHPAAREPGLVLRALLMLVAAGEIHPATGVPGPGPLAFNRRSVAEGWLAAPAIGGAIRLSPDQVESVSAVLSGRPGDRSEVGPLLRSLRAIP